MLVTYFLAMGTPYLEANQQKKAERAMMVSSWYRLREWGEGRGAAVEEGPVEHINKLIK